jgi:hypothetical protein
MLLAACEEEKAPPTSPPIANKFAPTDQGAATPGGSANSGAAAMMNGSGGAAMSGTPGGMASPHGGAPPKVSLTEALAQAPKLDPSLAPLQKAYESADAAYKKNSKDAAVKKTYVEAAYTYGHAIEYSEKVDQPAVKYRASLLLYRKALAADPAHADSIREKKQIESIYQGMGMPVPQ